MNCKKCGAQLTTEDIFCKKCGEKVEINQSSNNMVDEVVDYNKPVETEKIENNTTEPTMINEQNESQVNRQVVNNTPINNSKHNNMDVTKIILIVLLIIAIIIIVVLLLTRNNKSTPTTGNTTEPTATQVSNTYKITISSYEFTIPNELLITSRDNTQIVTDNTSWMASIEAETKAELKVTYSDVKASLDGIAEEVKNKGFTIIAKGTETHSNVEMVYIDIEYNKQKATLIYYELPQSGLGCSELLTSSGDINHIYMDKLGSIVSTAKYVGTTNNLKIDKSIDLKGTLKSIK